MTRNVFHPDTSAPMKVMLSLRRKNSLVSGKSWDNRARAGKGATKMRTRFKKTPKFQDLESIAMPKVKNHIFKIQPETETRLYL